MHLCNLKGVGINEHDLAYNTTASHHPQLIKETKIKGISFSTDLNQETLRWNS